MPHVITSGCCSDASCVSVCPVDCIHPTPDEPDFGTTPTLYVDPSTCINCGACVDACPVDAIGPEDRLAVKDRVFAIRNREYYEQRGGPVGSARLSFPSTPKTTRDLDVVVVGTGPAAHYTADLLLRLGGAEVTMIDRLPAAGGLLRHGVAPDHPATRRLGERFTGFLNNPRLHLLLGVEVGRDVTVDELLAAADAVVVATGAETGRRLGVPGEDLVGCLTSTEIVAWYNGHPEKGAEAPPLGSERAVVVGNGNVALDIARILLGDPGQLASTDIADRALAALRASEVREVVVVGRRGPAAAACTPGELHDLASRGDLEVVVAAGPGVADELGAAAPGTTAAELARLPVVDVDLTAPPPAGRRVVFAFGVTPTAIVGEDRVHAVRLDGVGEVPAGLVVTAIGHLGRPLPGLPFDDTSHTVPHLAGRVLEAPGGRPLPGRYVVGWIKRGASGGIGANRHDAAETVASLLADAADGTLPRPTTRGGVGALRRRLRRAVPGTLDRRAWRTVDANERAAGAASGRPRVRFTDAESLRAAARR